MALQGLQQGPLLHFLTKGKAIQLICNVRTDRQKATIQRAQVSENGASSNGSSAKRHSKKNVGTVEMYVASDDDFLDYGSNSGRPTTLQRSKSVHVPPPRNAAPQKLAALKSLEQSAALQADKGESKLLKAELGMTSAELKSKGAELQDTQRALRAREVELQLLKAAMAERDIRLRNAKTELMSTQAALKDKDAELQTAFQQLMTAAEQRGQVRQQLLDTQQELAETRSELEVWTQEASISGQEGGDKASATKQPQNGSLKPASDPRGNEVAKLLADLTRLSQQVADDALADEAVFKDAAAP